MPYSKRPIIILITEKDAAPYNWVVRNLKPLQQLGYKAICFEWCRDSTMDEYKMIVEEAVRGTKLAIKDLDKEPTKEVINAACMEQYNDSLYSCLLEIMKSKIDFAFIDMKKDVYFDQEMMPKSGINVSSLKQVREKMMAKDIVEKSKEHDGGTITILGSNHYTIYDEIKKIDEENIESFIYIELEQYHDIPLPGNYAKELRERIYESNKKRYQENVRDRIKSIEKYLPKKMFYAFDYTNVNCQNDLDKQIFSVISEKIENISIKARKDDHLEGESKALTM